MGVNNVNIIKAGNNMLFSKYFLSSACLIIEQNNFFYIFLKNTGLNETILISQKLYTLSRYFCRGCVKS